MIYITESAWFDPIIIFLIILNSIFLGMVDYTDPSSESWRNKLVSLSF